MPHIILPREYGVKQVQNFYRDRLTAPAYAPSPPNRRDFSRHRGGRGNNLFVFLFENREVVNPESTSRTFRIRAKAEVRDIGKCFPYFAEHFPNQTL